MKKLVLLLVVILSVGTISAQEKGKVRGGLDVGYAIPKGGGGVSFDLNLGYNIADNMNVGIRWASAALAKDLGDNVNASLTANTSYLGTFNYYFNNGSSSFAPFIGVGAGYYALGNLTASAGNDIEVGVDVKGKFGGLITAGFELSKFRLGLEYNLIPASKFDGDYKVSNSYFAVTLGFYLGGGKWKK